MHIMCIVHFVYVCMVALGRDEEPKNGVYMHYAVENKPPSNKYRIIYVHTHSHFARSATILTLHSTLIAMLELTSTQRTISPSRHIRHSIYSHSKMHTIYAFQNIMVPHTTQSTDPLLLATRSFTFHRRPPAFIHLYIAVLVLNDGLSIYVCFGHTKNGLQTMNVT